MKEKEKTKTKDVALLLMAGKGERLFDELKVKKQFYKFDGKELFLYSLESLALSGCFRDIVLVVSKEDAEKTADIVHNDPLLQKTDISIILGGESRNESVGNAVKALRRRKGNFNILIHDAARPFLTVDHVKNIMAKTYRADALTYAIPVADSIFHNAGKGIQYMDRKDLYQVQTPQVFDYRKLLEIYDDGYDPDCTDDFSKAVRAGLKTLPLPGDLILFKVTGKDDLLLLKRLSAMPVE